MWDLCFPPQIGLGRWIWIWLVLVEFGLVFRGPAIFSEHLHRVSASEGRGGKKFRLCLWSRWHSLLAAGSCSLFQVTEHPPELWNAISSSSPSIPFLSPPPAPLLDPPFRIWGSLDTVTPLSAPPWNPPDPAGISHKSLHRKFKWGLI